MERDDWDNLVECIDCGGTVDPSTDQAFGLGGDSFLCYACALRRGGIFDGKTDRWVTPPNVADEPDERRPQPW